MDAEDRLCVDAGIRSCILRGWKVGETKSKRSGRGTSRCTESGGLCRQPPRATWLVLGLGAKTYLAGRLLFPPHILPLLLDAGFVSSSRTRLYGRKDTQNGAGTRAMYR